MVNGKAKLLRDDYCDGLGDCLPACPTHAISFIHREAAEGKYRIGPHKERLNRIIDNWDTILAIIHDELPPYDWLYEKLRTIGFPLLPQDINIPDFLVKDAFLATKDIRDKYIGSRLLWDLGKLEEAADALF